ncbi:MAG: threonyl-tRNA synthetase [Candidatus Saccharimonadales bacterium]|jgi:threonyl-tRNA synthetase
MAEKQEKNVEAMRHSMAHIMASAVTALWPEARLGVGPVVENGFYYDIDIPGVTISEDDFKKIEKQMKGIINQNQTFEKSEMPVDDAINWAKSSGQPYKEELLNDLKRAGTTVAKDLSPEEMGTIAGSNDGVESVSFYTNGEFTDLCRGPHVDHTGQAGAFKLLRVAGAYWRGKEDNAQMQRLYGVAFNTKEELHTHMQMLEEAKKRDHRKIGKEMDLFVFSELVGQGLPLWTPRGTILRSKIDEYVQQLRGEYGYEPVEIPHITKKDLYVKSGHWDKFGDELFSISTREGHEFVMKPMNCPHHTQIYDSRQRSYRDLPIRYSNTTMVYRDEQSGELGGLARVRSITQDDAHVFCRKSQIKEEALKIWDIVERFYGVFDMPVRPELSFMDPEEPEKYLGDIKLWEEAQATLSELVMERLGEQTAIGVGEAAFYGPKIDFMAKDALGREHQVATIQLDFNQPERFDLSCIAEDGSSERILMIHAAIAGSFERFLSVLIEHTAGKFPLWMAPEQLRIITVNQEEMTTNAASEIESLAKQNGVRVYVDNDNESVGKKIRQSELAKIPYTLVIGEKEVANGIVSPRIRGDMQVIAAHPELHYEQFINTLVNESKSRINKSSL